MEKAKANDDYDPDKPIVLSVPEVSKRRQIWNRLTWWRPLTKREGANLNLVCLKLSEAVLNLSRIQRKLIANNNVLIQQVMEYDKILGKKVPRKIVKDKKEKSEPKHDQMFG